MDIVRLFLSLLGALIFGFIGITVLLMLIDLCLSVYTGHVHNFPWQH